MPFSTIIANIRNALFGSHVTVSIVPISSDDEMDLTNLESGSYYKLRYNNKILLLFDSNIDVEIGKHKFPQRQPNPYIYAYN